jgi:hypothetical protein
LKCLVMEGTGCLELALESRRTGVEEGLLYTFRLQRLQSLSEESNAANLQGRTQSWATFARPLQRNKDKVTGGGLAVVRLVGREDCRPKVGVPFKPYHITLKKSGAFKLI